MRRTASLALLASSLFLAAATNTGGFTNPPGTQWWAQQFPGLSAPGFNSIHFSGKDTGWAVGGTAIHKTVNGGNTWVAQDNPLITGGTVNLYSVHAVSPQIVYASGTGGTILKTTNGGTTWVLKNTGTSKNLNSVRFYTGPDSNVGYAFTDSAFILTPNAGEDWGTFTLGGTPIHINAVSFPKLGTGTIWIVGWDGRIYKNVAGGSEWISLRDSTLTTNFWGVDFVNDSIGWVVGDAGLIRKTTNAGATWTTQSAGTIGLFQAVRFANASTGWISGVSGIYKTTNGGATWINQTADSMSVSGSVSQFHVFDTNSAIGAGGGVLKCPATLTLTSPTGGEVWRAGSTHAITWSSSNIPIVNLESSTNGGASWSIFNLGVTATNGSLLWDVPDLPGNNYRIRVGNTGTWQRSEMGTPLSIVRLSITAPNFLTKWRAGSNQNITWTSTGMGTYVKLEYSLDTGTTWTLIADSILTAAGAKGWILPDTLTSFAKIRISATGNPGLNYVGNIFTITKLRLLSPNGGEVLAKGDVLPIQRAITWTAASDITTVNLQYTLNNGSSWTNITSGSGIPAGTGTYTWNYGSVANSTQARIRIQDNVYPEDVFDVSDSTFTISQVAGIDAGAKVLGFGMSTASPSSVRFTLPASEANVRLDMINARGKIVATLVNGPAEAGLHTVNVDVARIPSGIYTYRLKAGNKEIVRRVPALK